MARSIAQILLEHDQKQKDPRWNGRGLYSEAIIRHELKDLDNPHFKLSEESADELDDALDRFYNNPGTIDTYNKLRKIVLAGGKI